MPPEQLIETLIISGITLVVIFFIVLRGILKSLHNERKANDAEREVRKVKENELLEKNAHLEALKAKVTTQRDEIVVLKHQILESHATISGALQKTKVSSWQSTAVLVAVGIIALLIIFQISQQNRKSQGDKR